MRCLGWRDLTPRPPLHLHGERECSCAGGISPHPPPFSRRREKGVRGGWGFGAGFGSFRAREIRGVEAGLAPALPRPAAESAAATGIEVAVEFLPHPRVGALLLPRREKGSRWAEIRAWVRRFSCAEIRGVEA